MKSVTDSIEKVNITLVKTYAQLKESGEYLKLYLSESIQDDLDRMTEISKKTVVQAAEMRFQIQETLVNHFYDYDSMTLLQHRKGRNGATIYLTQEFVQRCVDMQHRNVSINYVSPSQVIKQTGNVSNIPIYFNDSEKSNGKVSHVTFLAPTMAPSGVDVRDGTQQTSSIYADIELDLTTTSPVPDKEEVLKLLADHYFFNTDGDVTNCDLLYRRFMKENTVEATRAFQRTR